MDNNTNSADNIDHWHLSSGNLLTLSFGNETPESVNIDGRIVVVVWKKMEMTHANLTDIMRMVLCKKNLVVSPCTNITTSSRMLPMLSNTTITHGNVSTALASLTETGDHFWEKK